MSELWPKEEIPNGNCLFLRVHKNNWENGPNAGALSPHAGGLSVNWCVRASAFETVLQAANTLDPKGKAKRPESYGLVVIPVSKARGDVRLTVEHCPKVNNRAHTNILGIPEQDCDDRTELRFKLKRFARPLYHPGDIKGVTFRN